MRGFQPRPALDARQGNEILPLKRPRPGREGISRALPDSFDSAPCEESHSSESPAAAFPRGLPLIHLGPGTSSCPGRRSVGAGARSRPSPLPAETLPRPLRRGGAPPGSVCFTLAGAGVAGMFKDRHELRAHRGTEGGRGASPAGMRGDAPSPKRRSGYADGALCLLLCYPSTQIKGSTSTCPSQLLAGGVGRGHPTEPRKAHGLPARTHVPGVPRLRPEQGQPPPRGAGHPGEPPRRGEPPGEGAGRPRQRGGCSEDSWAAWGKRHVAPRRSSLRTCPARLAEGTRPRGGGCGAVTGGWLPPKCWYPEMLVPHNMVPKILVPQNAGIP